MTHDDARQAIDALFASGQLAPDRWDRMFAHLRSGCEDCGAHYAAQRGALPDAGEAITRAESDAVRRVVAARAAASRRSLLAGRWPLVLSATAAMCAGAFWLVARQGDEVTERGELSGAQATVVCLTSDDRRRSSDEKDPCAVGDTLNVQTRAAARGGPALREVALVVLDRRFQILEDVETAPWRDELVSVPGPELRQPGPVRVLVLWLDRPLDRARLRRALEVIRPDGPSPTDLQRALPGLRAQRDLLVEVRGP